MKNQKLLSLCIPTWNRSKFLKLSLERLYEQFEDEEVSKNAYQNLYRNWDMAMNEVYEEYKKLINNNEL